MRGKGTDMGQAKEKEKQYYTVEEWLSWDEDVRSELYEGMLIMLAQPTQQHQEVLMEIASQIHLYLKGKPCKVFPAPFGVKLFKKEDTAFEPDIVVVCDKSKLDGKICNGAPDMVIEILSPSTERMDRVFKYRKYEKAGVREYWIVDPKHKYIQAGLLDNGKYAITFYEAEDHVAPVAVLEGCEINLADVFAAE